MHRTLPCAPRPEETRLERLRSIYVRVHLTHHGGWQIPGKHVHKVQWARVLSAAHVPIPAAASASVSA